MSTRSYKDLLVWSKSFRLGIDLYRATRAFPPDERYGLTLQTRKAVTSIPLNLAEGHERGTTPDFLHFVSIAQGSLAEIETLLLFARELEYLPGTEADRLTSQAEEVGRMLRGLRKSLRARIRTQAKRLTRRSKRTKPSVSKD